jgi:hypothetical protein
MFQEFSEKFLQILKTRYSKSENLEKNRCVYQRGSKKGILIVQLHGSNRCKSQKCFLLLPDQRDDVLKTVLITAADRDIAYSLEKSKAVA